MREVSVLLVDDEPDICWAIKALLRPPGYRLLSLNSGSEALSRLQQESFERIILDAKLQDMNGLDLAERIRLLNPNAWIVLVSAFYYRDDQAVIAALREGSIQRFVAKPFSHQALLDALDPERSAAEGAGEPLAGR
ncbi:MAG: hypothetical protein C1943_10700 [Halochromatium sp.]|nr:hypothetical protein [Halochromatium sp.]